MSLSYDTITMSKEAQEKFNMDIKNALCSTYGAYICLSLMGLGISHINDDTLPEIETREKIFQAIHQLDNTTGIEWALFKGLSTNVAMETQSEFLRRLSKVNAKTKKQLNESREHNYKLILEAKEKAKLKVV